jgi:hypothetical protein
MLGAHRCDATIPAWPCSYLQILMLFRVTAVEGPAPHASFFFPGTSRGWNRRPQNLSRAQMYYIVRTGREHFVN